MRPDFSHITDALSIIQSRLIADLPNYERLQGGEDLLSKRAIILLGPRGVGKSTFLLRLSQQLKASAFYLSLDNPLLAGISLYELGDWVFQNGYDTLICDEIHYLPDWSRHLKALYDSHPHKQIWASDSSTLVLRKGLGDLSRRFLIREFPYLSFREYLWLKHQVILPSMSFENLLAHKIKKFSCKFNIQKEFQHYIKSGTRPFFLEGDYEERALGIVDKIIHSDIPHFLSEVRETHLNLMRNIIGYLAMSPIPVVNIESLSKTWSVSKLTVYNLLTVMEDTSLINIVRYEGIKKGQSKGTKIFFADANLYAAYGGHMGNTREAFFNMQMKMMGKDVRCPKDPSQYDFSVDGYTFEIGGRSKKLKGADFVVRDDVDTATKKVIPLWMLGLVDEGVGFVWKQVQIPA